MIENISKVNLDDEVIRYLECNFGYDCLLSYACNYDKVNENIEYMKSLGINNVEKILMYRYDVVLMSNEKLVKKFSKFNIPSFVKLLNINEDAIDELFNR